MTLAVYKGRKANKILHFLKAIRSDVRICLSMLLRKLQTLTHLWLMDFPAPIIWTSRLSFLGASWGGGVFFHFYLIFGRKSYKQTE